MVQTSEKESMKDEFISRDLETKADGIPFEYNQCSQYISMLDLITNPNPKIKFKT